MNPKIPVFPVTGKTNFEKTLNARVNMLFKDTGRRKAGSFRTHIKLPIGLFLFLYPFISAFYATDLSWFDILWRSACSSLGMSFLGLAVAHDANHYVFSANKKFNRIVSYIFHLFGVIAANWRFKHNQLHHAFTNIDEIDLDISSPLFRFTPHQKRRWFHRGQAFYAMFLYSMMYWQWFVSADFVQMRLRFKKDDQFDKPRISKKTRAEDRIILWVTKVGFFSMFCIAPIIWWDALWYISLTYFIMLGSLTGLFLSLVFQPAHVVPIAQSYAADTSMSHSRFEHQVKTSVDFATNNPVLTWWLGGLNMQGPHHAYPNIAHEHYFKIRPIVQKTMEEFKYKYKSYPTWGKALVAHFKWLHLLGKPLDHPKAIQHVNTT